MFRFDKVAYLFKLESYSDSRILEIFTDRGRATVDTKKMYFYQSVTEIVIPAYYVRKEDVLYLMKEEPVFYA